METLGPSLLTSLRELRWLMSSGHSMREALRLHLMECENNFTLHLREWWLLKSQGRSSKWKPESHYQAAFLELVERGLAGQPTLEALRALEEEVEKAVSAELDLHLVALPIKVLIPLLLFLFPAFLLLLLGPMLRNLSEQMG